MRIPGQKLVARTRQLGQAFNATRKIDAKLVPVVGGVSLAVLVAVTVPLVLIGWTIMGPIIGVLCAVLAGLVVFGRRTQTAAIGSIEGRPGAAAAVLQTMRGPWIVQPAIAVTRKQDFVHRVVGRCGIVLVGEGSQARVASLLKQEARRAARSAGEDVPIHEVSVGNGAGQIPLGKLQAHMTRLPRKLKAREVGPLDTKLGALQSTDLPLPKGPMPRVPRKMR